MKTIRRFDDLSFRQMQRFSWGDLTTVVKLNYGKQTS